MFNETVEKEAPIRLFITSTDLSTPLMTGRNPSWQGGWLDYAYERSELEPGTQENWPTFENDCTSDYKDSNK